VTPGTRALVARALKLREARGRAALVEAQQEHARRLEAAARLADAMVREREFVDAAHAEAADPRLAGATFAAWRASAEVRISAARRDANRAGAACEPVRAVLTDTLRTAKGFETMMARSDDERARRDARRDPLLQLMLLPGRR